MKALGGFPFIVRRIERQDFDPAGSFLSGAAPLDGNAPPPQCWSCKRKTAGKARGAGWPLVVPQRTVTVDDTYLAPLAHCVRVRLKAASGLNTVLV